MMLALARLYSSLRNQPATLIATVHDEAVMLVPDDPSVAAAIADIARHKMIQAFTEVFPNAPVMNLVEPSIGPNWGEMQPMKQWLLTG